METRNSPLIVIDAGHGGYDNGAQWNGRLEKDDNLRLSLAVRDALQAQGVDTLMTRDTDVFIPLSDRADIANRNNADLFIAIHRNSYIEPTPTSHGVENYIYLTAPEQTTGRAAQLVLDAVVEAGVQSDRGVNRGNYYVVRRTNMPAMLLEMGFIINDEDNRLFDEKLEDYAQAIARGAMEYFGLQYIPPAESAIPAMSVAILPTIPVPPIGVVPPVTPVPPIGVVPPVTPVPPIGVVPPVTPVPPIGSVRPPRPRPPVLGNCRRPELVAEAQRALNSSFDANLIVDGVYGPTTKRAAVYALQTEINDSLGATIAVDGIVGSDTCAHFPTLRQGDRGNTVRLLQILLALNGYDPGPLDGIFGPRTATAVSLFQRDFFLVPDSVAGPSTFHYLLR